jgi:hypothetical protein
MHARLDDMAIARANMRNENALKLCIVQHRNAAQVAAHARALERHARKLQRLHAKVNAEATAISDANFANHHNLGLDKYESIASQQTDNEGCCSCEITDTESYRDLQQSYRAYKKVTELEIRTVRVVYRPYNQGTYGRSAGMARRPLTV